MWSTTSEVTTKTTCSPRRTVIRLSGARPPRTAMRTTTCFGGGGGCSGFVSVAALGGGGGGGGATSSVSSPLRSTRNSATATAAPATSTRRRHGARTRETLAGALTFTPMQAIAAGHPATADAGAEILAEGGSAADAAVAACLTSCVAESVMTGLLGGGHAIYHDAPTNRTANLDCFVAMPGLGVERREA